MAEHVRAFLRQQGLGAYADIFVHNGFDTLERLRNMQFVHMKAYGLKHGHAMHLIQILAMDLPPLCSMCGHLIDPYLGHRASYESSYPWAPWVPAMTQHQLGDATSSSFQAQPWKVPLPQHTGRQKQQTRAQAQPLDPRDLPIISCIVVMRLVMDSSVTVTTEATKPFLEDGHICKACRGHLEQAALLRGTRLPTQPAASSTTRRRVKREALAKLHERMELLVHDLRKGRKSIPSALDAERAAADITRALYMEQLSASDTSSRSTTLSFWHFSKYCDDPALHETSLGPALLVLKQAHKETRAQGNVIHALKTMLTLVCVRRAGGHNDREKFVEELETMFPDISDTSAMTLDMQLRSRHARVECRAALLQTFERVLGDIPNAFESNAKTTKARRAREATSEGDEAHDSDSSPPRRPGRPKSAFRQDPTPEAHWP